MLENKALRRISGPKREDLAEEWRRLHNEELHNSYTSQNIEMIMSRRMRWVGNVARRGEINAYKVLVGKPEGKRSL
jgi:hypothetical protein